MIYELKTYTPAPGKAKALRQRFVNVTLPLCQKHGIEIVAAMMPINDPDKLVYITRFADEIALSAAWQAFLSDPEWQFAKQQSDADGALLLDQQTQLMRSLPLA